MPRQILRAAALAYLLDAPAILVNERLHAVTIGAELRAADVDVRVETFHYHPQQSVLNRQEGQRQTACMRYMSAPQRSHFIASAAGDAGAAWSADTIGVTIRRGTGFGEGSSTPAL